MLFLLETVLVKSTHHTRVQCTFFKYTEFLVSFYEHGHCLKHTYYILGERI